MIKDKKRFLFNNLFTKGTNDKNNNNTKIEETIDILLLNHNKKELLYDKNGEINKDIKTFPCNFNEFIFIFIKQSHHITINKKHVNFHYIDINNLILINFRQKFKNTFNHIKYSYGDNKNNVI